MPAKVWIPVVTIPPFVPSAGARLNAPPLMEAPFAVELPKAATEVTPLAGGAADVQVVPLEISILPVVPGATACKALVPLPNKTLLSVRVAAPVPPLFTGRVPVTLVVRSIAPASISLVTFSVPIAVIPALVIVTSPAVETAAARFEPSPTMIFPDVSAEPTGEVPVMVVLVTPVTLPLASTAKTGTVVALP